MLSLKKGKLFLRWRTVCKGWNGRDHQGNRDGVAGIEFGGSRATGMGLLRSGNQGSGLQESAGVRAAGLDLGSHSLCPLYSVFANK